MSDPLPTPWSSRGAILPLAPLPAVPTPFPPLARVATPSDGPAADGVVLLTPWSSYPVPIGAALPGVDRLPALAGPVALPRPRSGQEAPAPA